MILNGIVKIIVLIIVVAIIGVIVKKNSGAAALIQNFSGWFDDVFKAAI